MVTKEERRGEGQTRRLGLIDTHPPQFCAGEPWLPAAGLLWSTEVWKNSHGRPESHTPGRNQKQQSHERCGNLTRMLVMRPKWAGLWARVNHGWGLTNSQGRWWGRRRLCSSLLETKSHCNLSFYANLAPFEGKPGETWIISEISVQVATIDCEHLEGRTQALHDFLILASGAQSWGLINPC